MAGEIVYGANAVGEALRAEGRVNRLYLAKDTKVRGAKALVERARHQGVPFDFVPQAKLSDMAGTREHQGVVATVSPVAYTDLDACLARCGDTATILVLDQVQHPKNVGMIIRTAVGAGADGVVLPSRGGALLDESVVRASAGTVFHLPIVQSGNLPQTLGTLKDAGFWAYGLAGGGDEDVFHTSWPTRCALVLGNETKGIRPTVQKACDVLVGIPLAGGLDSLNVAVAAGIALFQVTQSHSGV